MIKNSNWLETDHLAINTEVEELNSGLPNINPSNGRDKDLNPGPPELK